jgi:hypothetical protein
MDLEESLGDVGFMFDAAATKQTLVIHLHQHHVMELRGRYRTNRIVYHD